MCPEIEKALQEIDSATNGMTDEQLAWHPEAKWSTGDILEHLSRAFAGTIAGAQKALEKNSPRKREPTLRERLRVLLVVEFGHMPRGRKSPEVAIPRGIPPRVAFNSIRENLMAMDLPLAACEKQFGSSTKLLAHPILGPMTARQWRKLHWVHTRHHMRQVRALREQMQAASARSAGHP
jgi:hypothetical protein